MAKKETKVKKDGKKKMDPVVHFEMPVEDRKRMANFYSRAFGWQMHMLNKKMGNYVLATTAETDKKGMLKEPGRINGGFYIKTDNRSDQHPNIVIGVEDLKESMKKIEKAGGKILGEPSEIPGFGTYVSFYDTEHNRVSIIEP